MCMSRLCGWLAASVDGRTVFVVLAAVTDGSLACSLDSAWLSCLFSFSLVVSCCNSVCGFCLALPAWLVALSRLVVDCSVTQSLLVSFLYLLVVSPSASHERSLFRSFRLYSQTISATVATSGPQAAQLTIVRYVAQLGTACSRPRSFVFGLV